MANNNKFWNTVIAVQIVLYIVLTTAIFVLHKKISILQAAERKQQSDSHEVQQQMTSDEKMEFLEKKLQENPKDEAAHRKMADLHYQQGNVGKATEHYAQITENAPQNSQAHFKLAVLYMSDQQNHAKALEHFRKVLELEPNHPKKRVIELWMEQLQK